MHKHKFNTVTHICPASPYGGIQRLIETIVPAQIKSGLNVKVCLCANWSKNSFSLDSERMLRDNLQGMSVPHEVYSALDKVSLNKMQMDARNNGIIHLHAPPLWFIVEALPFKRQPWVLHIHNYPRTHPHRAKYALIEALLMRACDGFIAVSNSVADDIKRSWHINNRKLFVVHNCLDVKSKEEMFRRSEASFDGPVFAMASRLEIDKGVDLFVRAAAVIKNELPDATFILAGEGSLIGDVTDLIKELGLEGPFSLLEFQKDISKFWANADFALFTAPREPFGLRILEAQSGGAIIVGFKNNSGSDEVIINNKTGVLVEMGDYRALARACKELWTNREKMHSIRDAAFTTLTTNFSTENTVKRLSDVYSTL